MKLLVFSLGFTLQTWLCQARIPQNPTRITDLQINPNPGSSGLTNQIVITAGQDLSVNNLGNANALALNSNVSVVRGLECGSVVQMYSGNSAQVFSTNFGVANYYNNEACTWKFEANQCTLSAHCPCVDIPRSWECLGDYLKIRTDYVLQNQRFCGGNKPGQPIYSNSDFLSVRFRSDGKSTAAGFTCFIRCEGPGMNIPIRTNVTCPTISASQG